MIRTDEWKYIEYPAVDRQQLFHLKQDPDERTNLISVEAHSATRDQLKTQMRNWFRNQGDSVYVGADAEK
jgi:arylsulfatase A-like enzyme